MKKLLLCLGAAAFAAAQGMAYDFLDGGLAFNKLTDNTVEVTRINDDPTTDPLGTNFVSLYTDEVYNIPETVSHDGTTYTVTRINDHTFYAAKNVKEVHLSDKVTEIGTFAFQGCAALGNLEMPGIKKIDRYAFGGCYSLHSLRLPATMTDLEGSAFCGRDPQNLKAPLRTLIFDCDPGIFSNKPFNTRSVFDDIEELIFSAKVPAVTISTPFGFAGLRTVTFEESPKVLSIGSYPFGSCRATRLNIYRPLDDSTPFTLHSYYVTRQEIHIGDFAPFEIGAPNEDLTANCTLYVHNNQLEAYKAHEQWGKFANIAMEPGTDVPVPDLTYGYNYTLDADGMTAEIIAAGEEVDPYTGEHQIPEMLRVGGKWFTVTSIGYQAFFGTTVTSVTLPPTIKSIKQSAFGINSDLASVSLNEGLEEIAWDAFAATPNLKSITIPGSVKTVPFNAFGNSGIETLIVNDGVETIEAAFTNCANLTSVSLPETLTKLDGTFENCAALKSIVLPTSLREIGWFTFAGTGIETLEIPEGME
ncbi:MAG: leucine-rich repeat domain-containing protein, partial [Muribaculaceae bacterium]|nr:leucine-rich repeat domain-containing protein [Muribaculaceae bacterium]